MRWMCGLGILGGCEGFEPLADPIDSDELLSGLVDLSQEVEALERKVAALDARGAVRVDSLSGCTTVETVEALLGAEGGDNLSLQRPFGRFEGLLVTRRADETVVDALGLRLGDRILGVQGWAVDTPEAREQVLRTLEVAEPSLVTFEVARSTGRQRSEVRTLTLRLAPQCD